jgi:DNA-binding PadR family transcriptional regulator
VTVRPLHDAGDDALLAHLLTACVLLLLYETPATSGELHSALAALRLHEDPAVLQFRLAAMEDSGLVYATWGPGATAPERHTFHIAEDGLRWLQLAADELRSTKGFLGSFVARYEERFVAGASGASGQGRSGAAV